MRNTIKALRAIRQELESLCPRTGIAKWAHISHSLRVAGQPRSVSAAVRVALLTDMIVDREVEGPIKDHARKTLKRHKQIAAYQETVWLNQKQLKKYLAEFRANGYREPEGYYWVEDREENPYPKID